MTPVIVWRLENGSLLHQSQLEFGSCPLEMEWKWRIWSLSTKEKTTHISKYYWVIYNLYIWVDHYYKEK